MATMLQDGPQVLGTTWMDLAHIESTRKIIKISLTLILGIHVSFRGSIYFKKKHVPNYQWFQIIMDYVLSLVVNISACVICLTISL